MSTHGRVPPADDTLARAENALRSVPTPDGPSPETLSRTLAALSEADRNWALISLQRRQSMWMLLKMTAAVLAAAGGVTYFAGSPPAPATAAFVAAAQQLRDAHTLSFRMSTQFDGMPAPKIMQVRYKDPGMVRYDLERHDGAITIMDSVSGKTLTLDPAQKSAFLVQSPPPKGREARRDVAASIIDNIRQLANKNGEPVGAKIIGDVRARGFRVKEDGQTMTVWVDPKASLPLLIESAGSIGSSSVKTTFSDIKLAAPLDDAIFSFEIPRGYTIRNAVEPVMSPEEAVVNVLRMFADNTGGNFPTRLDDLPVINKAIGTKLATKKTEKAFDERENYRLSMAIGRILSFPTEFKDHYGYKAEGVKLGDAGKIVFWYRPDGETKYRVVYGDLHVGDVTAELLPATRRP
jgi:outer membrane lipoprotein-sorting protein